MGIICLTALRPVTCSMVLMKSSRRTGADSPMLNERAGTSSVEG